MDEDRFWWKWFHVAKTEMEYWRFRCAMSEVVAGVFMLISLWQYCHR